MDWGCGDVAERGIKAMWNEPSSQSASQPTNQRASDNDDDTAKRIKEKKQKPKVSKPFQ